MQERERENNGEKRFLARPLSADFSFFAPEPCGCRFSVSRFPAWCETTHGTEPRDDEQWKVRVRPRQDRSRELITHPRVGESRLSQKRGISFPDENLTARVHVRNTFARLGRLMNKFH